MTSRSIKISLEDSSNPQGVKVIVSFAPKPKVEVKEQDFLERAEEEKKELEESYRESLRQANERKFHDET